MLHLLFLAQLAYCIVEFPLKYDQDTLLYRTEVWLGTPPQKIWTLIDTGSSDLWVTSVSDKTCQNKQSGCGFGLFSWCCSSSFSVLDVPDFNIGYDSGNGAKGAWSEDVLRFNGGTLRVKFGLAEVSNLPPVFGIGFEENESTSRKNPDSNSSSDYTYANVPSLLKEKGFIDKKLFSLYFKGPDGKLSFGGSNSLLYHGQLHTVPFVNIHGEGPPLEFHVEMDLAINSRNLFKAKATLLDTGSVPLQLPSIYINTLQEIVPEILYSEENEGYMVPCSTSATFTMTFKDFSFDIPLSQYTFPANDTFCGLYLTPGDTVSLGLPFFQFIYTVFDLDECAISMALTK